MNDTAEIIEKIRPYAAEKKYFGSEAGFQIVTNKQTVTLAIDDDSSCCERWGYFLTEDDTDKFVGAQLRGVRITDTNRSSKTFPTWNEPHSANAIAVEDGDVMFVDIETDRGVLQFVAYNAHNGYYGHNARVSSMQLTESKIL